MSASRIRSLLRTRYSRDSSIAFVGYADQDKKTGVDRAAWDAAIRGRWPYACQSGREVADRLADRQVAVALGLINRRFQSCEFTLRSAAAELRMSPWHLTRLLKKKTGRGFRWHLQEVRLINARVLLRSTMLSVKEITAAVGYRQVSDFDRIFKARHGLTPTEYRGYATDPRAFTPSVGATTDPPPVGKAPPAEAIWRRRRT